jgi:hypothetical protein
MKKELELDRRTVDIVLNTIKARISPELDITGFYGYNEETQEYGLWYKGPGNPTKCDFKLASVYLSVKQQYEYYADLGISFDMDITGE